MREIKCLLASSINCWKQPNRDGESACEGRGAQRILGVAGGECVPR
jgi:hypothetical protein